MALGIELKPVLSLPSSGAISASQASASEIFGLVLIVAALVLFAIAWRLAGTKLGDGKFRR